jgi:hypothetical protein
MTEQESLAVADSRAPGAALRGAGDLRLAVIVDPGLPLGLLANTVAVIAAGLAAAVPGIGGVCLRDAEGVAFFNSADRPIPILGADGPTMTALLMRAAERPDEARIVAFPAFARSLHAFADYAEALPSRRLGSEKLDGLGLVGPSRWVRSLTGALKLLR